MSLLKRIKNIGAPKGVNNPIDIGVLNLSILLFIVPGLNYVFLFWFAGFYEACIIQLCSYVLAGACIPLIKRGKTEMAKYLFITVAILAIASVGALLHEIRGVYVFLLVVIGISYIISKKGSQSIVYFSISLSIVLYFISNYLSEFAYKNLDETIILICNYSLFPVGFIVMALIVSFFRNSLNEALDEKAQYITHLRQTQEELTAQSEVLESINGQLEEFTYIASHDLKTPIRGIHHYAQFLEEDFDEQLPEEAKSMISGIKKLTVKMDSLVSDVLSFSKAEKVDLELKNFNLADVIEEVKKDIGEQPDIVIDISFSEMPEVRADIVGIREAFLNFVTNAYKYNDSLDKTIAFSFHPDVKELHITDNGIGIAKENQDIVFAFFKRVHGKNEYGGGTGAGMAIVKKILERQGIIIKIESEIGKGTTFRLDLKKVLV